MIRTLKGLGLALVAVLALSAIAAGSASAAFESEGANPRLTRAGNNNQAFKYSTFSLTVNCSTVGGVGAGVGTFSEESKFAPTYTGCSTSLGQEAEVNMNGCEYVFTSAKGSTSATVHIVCSPIGNKIKITITEPPGTTICDLTVGAQTPGGTISLKNTGTGTTRDIDVISSLTGIVGSREGSSLCGPLTSTTGTYTGEVTVTGEDSNGNHTGIWVD